MMQAGLAIVREIDDVAALLQRLLRELCRLSVVFDDQNAHRQDLGISGLERAIPSASQCRGGDRSCLVACDRIQPFLIWTATKREASPDLTRRRTALRPAFSASSMALSTSAADVDRRCSMTSRMMSPARRPLVGGIASQLFTSAISTPSLTALAGAEPGAASEKPRLGPVRVERQRAWPGRPWRACGRLAGRILEVAELDWRSSVRGRRAAP